MTNVSNEMYTHPQMYMQENIPNYDTRFLPLIGGCALGGLAGYGLAHQGYGYPYHYGGYMPYGYYPYYGYYY